MTPDPLTWKYNDKPVCPYCGTPNDAAAATFELVGAMRCESCKAEFICTRHVDVRYSTTKVKP